MKYKDAYLVDVERECLQAPIDEIKRIKDKLEYGGDEDGVCELNDVITRLQTLQSSRVNNCYHKYN